MKVTKKNGNIVLFDDDKVIRSMLRANADTDEETLTESAAAYIAGEVFAQLAKERDLISTADVRQCVKRFLEEKGLPETARLYMDYHK